MTQATTVETDPPEIRYLVECERERHQAGIVTTVRRRPWRFDTPVFMAPDQDHDPANLIGYSLRGSRVLLTGKPESSTRVLERCRDARSLYVDGHYPSVTAPNGAVITYAGQWFGDDATPDECEQAWEWLGATIRAEWRDRYAVLHGTPATTGRDLFARSLGDAEWPVMSPQAQDIVRRTGGQGRMEMFRPQAEHIGTLYEYDARMAYVGLMANLPVGEPDALGALAAHRYQRDQPYREGRYRVEWAAPRDWAYPGILPAHGPEEGPDWVWPTEGEGWCSGVELFTALQAGWQVQIRGAIVWPAQGNPLHHWRHRLLRVLAQSEPLPGRLPLLIRRAVRSMLLHTIGSFHGARRKVTKYGTTSDVTSEAGGIRWLPDGRVTWWEYQSPAWPEMVHPEWSVTVWGRARARLVLGHRGRTGMLSADPRTLVAVRTDAVYTTEPTGWDELDDGQPGRYRLATYPGGRWPANSHELLNMRESR